MTMVKSVTTSIMLLSFVVVVCAVAFFQEVSATSSSSSFGPFKTPASPTTFGLAGIVGVSRGGGGSSSSSPPEQQEEASPEPRDRNVVALSEWAQQEGIKMHEALKWKDYGEAGGWGLVLTKRVPPSTVLLQVPRNLILDSTVLKSKQSSQNVKTAVDALGQFALHEPNLWIVLELYKLKCHESSTLGPPASRWAPWLEGMPTEFPQFTPQEQECLPYFAKYAAQYQDLKFEAFCKAATALGYISGSDETEITNLKWAFQCANSRFWKIAPKAHTKELGVVETTELVPIGDMFNHRDPYNVQMTVSDSDSYEDYVTFAYLGDEADKDADATDENYERDLFITYGQPGNPHRFLAIFGFVPPPSCMPRVWSHLVYGDSNPFSTQVDEMVFHVEDGKVADIVWDAILFELLEVDPKSPDALKAFMETKDDKKIKYKKYTADILQSHVTKQLDELATLRTTKIDSTQGPNMDLIKQHNDFLTSVFTKVRENPMNQIPK